MGSKLSSIVWETTAVEATPGTYVEFRGLNVNDFIRLGFTDGAGAEMIFQKIMAADFKNMDSDAVKSLLMEALKETPDLVLQGLALAADDDSPEGIEQLRRAPMTFQMEAIEAVLIQTIKSESELKKAGEILLRLMGNVRAMAEAAKTQVLLRAGSGKSGRG